jgi:small subunit ribosomal protein S20
MRQQEKRRMHNRAQRSRIKTAIKDVLKAPSAESGAAALKEAAGLLDRIQPQPDPSEQAARKSQLAHHVARLSWPGRSRPKEAPRHRSVPGRPVCPA